MNIIVHELLNYIHIKMNKIEFVFGNEGNIESDLIRLVDLLNKEIKSLNEVLVYLSNEIVAPKPYLLLSSENKIWKVEVDDEGTMTAINASPGTMLLTTDPLIIEKGSPFVIKISQALDQTGERITGEQTVNVVSSNQNEGNGGVVNISAITFVDGTAEVTITLEHSSEQTLAVSIGDLGELCEGTIDVDVIQTGQLNVYSSASSVERDTEIPGLYIDRAFAEDGNLINGNYYLQILSDDVTEGDAGEVAKMEIEIVEGTSSTIGNILLSNPGQQVLTFKIAETNLFVEVISEGTLTITVLQ